MISHEHKFLFIHMPRTGGTNLVYLLKEYSSYTVTVEQTGLGSLHCHIQTNDSQKKLFGRQFNHKNLEWYYNVFGPILNSYLKFIIVRNPWSMFASICSLPSNQPDSIITYNTDRLYRSINDNLYLQMYNDAIHTMDYVLLFEQYQQSVNVLFRKLKLPLSPEKLTIKRNTGMQGAHNIHYSNAYRNDRHKFIKLIGDKYKTVINHFNYTFEQE